MKTITITARKGGDGKTTTAHTIAAGLARKGFKVLMLDLDSQANLTRRAGASEEEKTICEALRDPEALKDCIKHLKDYDIIPGALDIVNLERNATGTAADYLQIKQLLSRIKNKYDYCVVDTSANIGVFTTAAIIAADKIIIPLRLSADSIQGLQQLLEVVKQINKRFEPVEVAGILPTQYKKRVVIDKILESLRAYADESRIKIYDYIRECIAIQEAELLKVDLYEYAPKSNAAADYNKVIDDLMRA